MIEVAREAVLDVRTLRSRVNGSVEIDISNVHISAGEWVAIIGGNGAGKTALLEAMLGLRACDARDVCFFGQSADHFDRIASTRRSFGVQLQQSAFRYDSTVQDLIRLHRSLYGECSPRALEFLGLDRLARRRYGFLSGGEKRRVDLYIALAHSPRLVVLDEPAAGLDQQFARGLRIYLAETKARTAILMVTHAPEDLRFADRVLWIERGRAAGYGDPMAIRLERLGGYRAEIRVSDQRGLEGWRAALAQAPQIHAYWEEQRGVFFAQQDMEEPLRRVLKAHPVEFYAFSASSDQDLLWLASRGSA
jgi:ABC-2 type transport system ATP-binding protein